MNIVYPKTTIQDVESLQNEVLEHIQNSHLMQKYNEHKKLFDKYLNLIWISSWICAICFGFCVCCLFLLSSATCITKFLITEILSLVMLGIIFVWHHRIEKKENKEANSMRNVSSKFDKLCHDISILRCDAYIPTARNDCALLSNLQNLELLKDFLKNNETIQLVNKDRYTFRVQLLINGYPYKTASFVTNGSEEQFKKITTYDFTFIDDMYDDIKSKVYSYLTNPDFA